MLQTLFKSARPAFLILAPVNVFLGFATVFTFGIPVGFYDLFLVVVGAVSAHISVNSFNEYFDFKSGLDVKTSRTPFSGGSGALVENPAAASAVLYMAVSALFLTVLVGIYFIYERGPAIIPVGVLGVLIILTYTPWLNRNPFLCLVAPGLGFGPLMVVGTYFVLTGTYSFFVFFVSMVPFFLANNLLLLNQIPDIEADKISGRRHFPIIYGVRASVLLYGIFVAMTCLVIVSGILLGYIPAVGYFCFLPLTGALGAFAVAVKHGEEIEKLIPALAMNVIAAVVTPLILGISLIYG